MFLFDRILSILPQICIQFRFCVLFNTRKQNLDRSDSFFGFMTFTTSSPFQGSNQKWHFSPEFCSKKISKCTTLIICAPPIYVSARFLAASAAHFDWVEIFYICQMRSVSFASMECSPTFHGGKQDKKQICEHCFVERCSLDDRRPHLIIATWSVEKYFSIYLATKN